MINIKYTQPGDDKTLEVKPADNDPKIFLHIGLGITDERANELSQILIKALSDYPSTVSSMEECSKHVKNSNELAYIMYAMGVENQRAGQIAVEAIREKGNGKKIIN